MVRLQKGLTADFESVLHSSVTFTELSSRRRTSDSPHKAHLGSTEPNYIPRTDIQRSGLEPIQLIHSLMLPLSVSCHPEAVEKVYL